VIGDRRVSATAQVNLGYIHFSHLNNPKEAVYHYQQGVELFREIGHIRGLAYSLRDLGLAHLAAEEPQKARESLSDALKFAWELNDRPMCLYFILAFAEYFANQNIFRQALELVTLVSEHNETLPDQKEQANQLKTQFERQFDLETVQSIRQNPPVLRLEKVILGLM
jgi:tetratricopeptide (TPR) repeat protein